MNVNPLTANVVVANVTTTFFLYERLIASGVLLIA